MFKLWLQEVMFIQISVKEAYLQLRSNTSKDSKAHRQHTLAFQSTMTLGFGTYKSYLKLVAVREESGARRPLKCLCFSGEGRPWFRPPWRILRGTMDLFCTLLCNCSTAPLLSRYCVAELQATPGHFALEIFWETTMLILNYEKLLLNILETVALQITVWSGSFEHKASPNRPPSLPHITALFCRATQTSTEVP